MLKRLFLPIIFICLVVVGLVGYIWFHRNLLAVSSSDQTQEFLITKGTGAIKTATNLEKAGLIRNALVFRIYMKISGAEGRIQAGQYDLSPSMSTAEIIKQLLLGPNEVWVTIPEGMRKEEIGEKFILSFGLKDQKAIDFRSEFRSLTKDKEGYLFPDTYLFEKTTTATKVVNYLTNTFTTKTKGLDTDYETIIVASLLERETFTDEEKPTVVAIIYKRLDAGWPLQIDAAVQYAVTNSKLNNSNTVILDEYWKELTKADIDISSPYNTYKRTGLPPTPIANPGLASLKAAINKQMETDYYFYLHDSKGQIHYAKTLEEHNANVRKYLNK
ncbi:MAG: endolytic transglycosylase MltG [Patescibacteria group bacterium]